uniref:Uncharacterized protein n=1 Tax=Anguilla anguilla TaxID=7936 RepID=A0A0E9QL40_ANGAN
MWVFLKPATRTGESTTQNLGSFQIHFFQII